MRIRVKWVRYVSIALAEIHRPTFTAQDVLSTIVDANLRDRKRRKYTASFHAYYLPSLHGVSLVLRRHAKLMGVEAAGFEQRRDKYGRKRATKIYRKTANENDGRNRGDASALNQPNARGGQ